MYHQEGSDTMYVGGRAVIYVLTFTSRGVRDLQVGFTARPALRSAGSAVGWGLMTIAS